MKEKQKDNEQMKQSRYSIFILVTNELENQPSSHLVILHQLYIDQRSMVMLDRLIPSQVIHIDGYNPRYSVPKCL